jgi:signal peptidase II
MIYRFGPFIIAAIAFLLDHLTKFLIRSSHLPPEGFPVIPGFFNIVHNENPGVAFGLFANSTGAFRTFVLIGLSAAVLVVIGTILLKRPKPAERRNWLLRVALALVLGGALGNLYDRIVRGTVTDFVQLHAGQSYYFPDFNVADSCITIGAALLIIDMWRSRERRHHTVDALH